MNLNLEQRIEKGEIAILAVGGHKCPEMICQSDPPDREVTVGGSTSGLYEAEKVWRGKCGCYRRFIA